MYSWGSNSAGQLGSRTFRDKAAPTEVKDLAAKGVAQVACGAEHSLFLLRCAALLQLRLQGSVARRCDNGLQMSMHSVRPSAARPCRIGVKLG